MADRLQVEKRIELSGHRSAVYCLAGDARWLYSAGGDGWLARWCADGSQEDGVLLAQTESRLFSLCLLTDKNLIVAGDMQGHLYWIDLEARRILARTAFHKGSIFSIIRTDADHLLTTSGDGSICLWHIDSLKPLQSMQLSAQGLRSSWLDNSRFLYTGASDCHIYITDVIGWQPVGVWRNAHDNSVFAVSGKGEVLLTGGRDAHLKAHHLSGGQLISNQPAHWFTINAICPMNAISCFATASRDKTIRIWNDADVTPLYTLDVQRGGHVNSVNALHWNEEMKLLASAGDDRIIRLWSLV